MTDDFKPAPEWDIAQWFNAPTALSLSALRGRIIVAGAFQMLCPGCVAQTIPQLRQAHAMFSAQGVAVIGLHTVFEHHDAMGPRALAAFLHEYRISFPVGVDRAVKDDPIPATMRRYRMQGTPTLLLIDKSGRLRRQTFGHVPDLQLGAEIGALTSEADATSEASENESACDDAGCAIRSSPVS